MFVLFQYFYIMVLWGIGIFDAIFACLSCKKLYVTELFYCVKYPYLILTNAYVLAGANMDDQTRIFLK